MLFYIWHHWNNKIYEVASRVQVIQLYQGDLSQILFESDADFLKINGKSYAFHNFENLIVFVIFLYKINSSSEPNIMLLFFFSVVLWKTRIDKSAICILKTKMHPLIKYNIPRFCTSLLLIIQS